MDDKGRILVVDDKPAVRQVLERVLKRAGHDVVLAENGKTALSALGAGAFDLVVIDRALPDIPGIEVVKQAREKQPRAKAIMITGLPTRESEAEARALGVRGYFVKPFDVSDILHECQSAIEASRQA